MSVEEYLEYYRGTLKQVMVRSASGKTVRFPASLLQPFLMPEGIHGDFVLICDEHFRRARLERVKGLG